MLTTTDVLLEIDDLRTHFFTRDGVVRAVDGVSLNVPRGKTVCVVGESGCGKSMTARSVLGLIDPPGRIISGAVRWHSRRRAEGLSTVGEASEDGAGPIDLAALGTRSEQIRQIRGREISMVFQEPMASLSPMYTIGAQLIETLRVHLDITADAAREHSIDLLKRVGIPRAEQRMDTYPFQLSGGMCQRVMIAIALACGPSLLIADEPTTALDVTTQARIIDLLRDLQEDTGMSILFITHDLGVVAEIADEVVVMYLGTVVEQGSVGEIFDNPKHPYTRALLESIPRMGAGTTQRLATIRGNVPHPSERPAGCPFHPRCDQAIMGVCETVEPRQLRLGRDGVGVDSSVRCVLYDDHAETAEVEGAERSSEEGRAGQ